MKKLGIEVLNLMWSYCMEDIVENSQSQHNQVGRHLANQIGSTGGSLCKQVHAVAIESFCYCLNYLFEMSSFYFMKLCVDNISRNYSVIASQAILMKLIQGTAFPI